jgi:Reverse transcriptase (RNA-dependent DNA polymerase)
MNAAFYPHDRIQSVESLLHPLGLGPAALERLARRASKLYFIARRIPKDDGTTRSVFDTRPPLKLVLQSINKHFLKRVQYPDYLTGGLPGKDYKKSVDRHSHAATVIKEDISKFYPSVTDAVVYDIWHRFFGFADEVATLLTRLTTRDGHLEQGAPTSGFLANLALWDVEPQIVDRLAERGWSNYSRHVDDVYVSSPAPRDGEQTAWAVSQVYGMLRCKNLQAKRAKHKVMQSCESITILKLVGNAKASLPKQERSRVRAIAHRYSQKAAAGEDVAVLVAELPRAGTSSQGQTLPPKQRRKVGGNRRRRSCATQAVVSETRRGRSHRTSSDNQRRPPPW